MPRAHLLGSLKHADAALRDRMHEFEMQFIRGVLELRHMLN